MLGLQGCTQITARWEVNKPDIMAAKQADSSMSSKSVTKNKSHDLWESLRQGFMLPKLTSSAVAPQAKHIAESGLPQQAFARASPLLHLMMKEIQRRKLPMELVLLPFVESSFLPQAHSPVGASYKCVGF